MSGTENIDALLKYSPISSGESVRPAPAEAEIAERIAVALEEETTVGPEEALSPVFKELREPKLPALARENRARLQMQTPNRVYFYWTLKNNPFQILHRVFGDDRGSYTLVLKLINTTRETEEIHPVDAEGNWWFSVDADTSYRAEIGFYAPNRPYFRALYSNTVTTPRKSPSPRIATDADWMITADKFSEVLEVSGFRQDAYEVALAGDDLAMGEAATRGAFAQLLDDELAFVGFSAEELRFALLALASGVTIESLRWSISSSLFTLLQEHLDKLSTDAALGALRDHFAIRDDKEFEEEPVSTVYGASLIHFPKNTRRRLLDFPDITGPRVGPFSSHSVGLVRGK